MIKYARPITVVFGYSCLELGGGERSFPLSLVARRRPMSKNVVQMHNGT